MHLPSEWGAVLLIGVPLICGVVVGFLSYVGCVWFHDGHVVFARPIKTETYDGITHSPFTIPVDMNCARCGLSANAYWPGKPPKWHIWFQEDPKLPTELIALGIATMHKNQIRIKDHRAPFSMGASVMSKAEAIAKYTGILPSELTELDSGQVDSIFGYLKKGDLRPGQQNP